MEAPQKMGDFLIGVWVGLIGVKQRFFWCFSSGQLDLTEAPFGTVKPAWSVTRPVPLVVEELLGYKISTKRWRSGGYDSVFWYKRYVICLGE